MNELQKLLSENNPASWETAFQQFVKEGDVTLDSWLWNWLWYRIIWPDNTYSLFNSGNILLAAPLFGVNVLIEVGDENKRRYVMVKLFESNPYHPDFMEMIQVEEREWRFPAIGNPYIDEPNYERWEQQLFCKLVNIAFEQKGGLAFLMDRSNRIG